MLPGRSTLPSRPTAREPISPDLFTRNQTLSANPFQKTSERANTQKEPTDAEKAAIAGENVRAKLSALFNEEVPPGPENRQPQPVSYYHRGHPALVYNESRSNKKWAKPNNVALRSGALLPCHQASDLFNPTDYDRDPSTLSSYFRRDSTSFPSTNTWTDRDAAHKSFQEDTGPVRGRGTPPSMTCRSRSSSSSYASIGFGKPPSRDGSPPALPHQRSVSLSRPQKYCVGKHRSSDMVSSSLSSDQQHRRIPSASLTSTSNSNDAASDAAAATTAWGSQFDQTSGICAPCPTPQTDASSYKSFATSILPRLPPIKTTWAGGARMSECTTASDTTGVSLQAIRGPRSSIPDPEIEPPEDHLSVVPIPSNYSFGDGAADYAKAEPIAEIDVKTAKKESEETDRQTTKGVRRTQSTPRLFLSRARKAFHTRQSRVRTWVKTTFGKGQANLHSYAQAHKDAHRRRSPTKLSRYAKRQRSSKSLKVETDHHRRKSRDAPLLRPAQSMFNMRTSSDSTISESGVSAANFWSGRSRQELMRKISMFSFRSVKSSQQKI